MTDHPVTDDFPGCSQPAPSCSKSGSSERCADVACPGKARCGDPDCALARQSGSSEDEVIPQAAIEALAILYYTYSTGGHTPWDHPKHVDIRFRYRRDATNLLEAALPHLRPLFTTATRVGYELGRREAGEQIAAMLEAEEDPDGFAVVVNRAAFVRRLARQARDLIKGDPK